MTPHDNQLYCLWEIDGMELVVGIVGSGPGFWSLAEILSDESYRTYLPPMRMAAVAEPDLNQSKIRELADKGVPVFPAWRDMLRDTPEINLIVDIKGALDSPRSREELPEGVSLVDRRAAVFLCGLHTMHQAALHSRTRLDRSQALLKAVATQIREDIMLLDMDGRVVDMNDHVRQRTGRTKTQLLGQPCWRVQTLAKGVPFCRVQRRAFPGD